MIMPDNTEFTGSPPPTLSDALDKILANPQLISMMASSLSGIMSQAPTDQAIKQNEDSSEPMPSTPEEKVTDTATPPDMGSVMASLAPLMSSFAKNGSPKGDHNRPNDRAHDRKALLCALKPYVSNGRRDAIDYIIRISEISDIIRR